MKTIFNVYNIDKTNKDLPEYVIMFGNSEHGWGVDKDELKEYWKRGVRLSATRTYGDITLLRYGKLIRSVNNFNNKILDKEARFKCKYTKYE